jgi:hypothetical protein
MVICTLCRARRAAGEGMSRRDWATPYVVSAWMRAKYGQLLLARGANEDFYRKQVNEALECQREGIPEAGYFRAEAIDRKTYATLTGDEAPLNAHRLLAAWTNPTDKIPHFCSITVAVLMDELAARERTNKAVETLREFDEHLPDMVTPSSARNRRLNDRLERERDGKVFNAQLALRQILRLQDGLAPIAEDEQLRVTVMFLPLDGVVEVAK